MPIYSYTHNLGSKRLLHMRTLRCGPKAQDKGDFRSHALQDPYRLLWSFGPLEAKSTPTEPRADVWDVTGVDLETSRSPFEENIFNLNPTCPKD